jgi:hypothetical protein
MAMGRLASLCGVLVLAGLAAPARAGDYGACGDTAYWCTRDAIYDRVNTIARLEADPNVDEAVKGPIITAARAEIHRLRATLGPPEWEWSTPCCYTRKPLHIRRRVLFGRLRAI